MTREPEAHLLSEADDAPLPEWRRPAPLAAPTVVAADHPVTREPGKCQICHQYRPLTQVWPSTLPARYADLCDDCRKLGDTEIARRLPFPPVWPNGATL